MTYLITLISLFLIFKIPDFTYNVTIIGQLKTSANKPVSKSFKILVFDGMDRLADGHTNKSGKFMLDFLTGSRTESTIDVFSVANLPIAVLYNGKVFPISSNKIDVTTSKTVKWYT